MINVKLKTIKIVLINKESTIIKFRLVIYDFSKEREIVFVSDWESKKNFNHTYKNNIYREV